MSKQRHIIEENPVSPVNFYRHLPFPLPVVQAKSKKKCCKKHKKGKRCKSCPGA